MFQKDKNQEGNPCDNAISPPLFVFSLFVFVVLGFVAGRIFSVGPSSDPSNVGQPLVVSKAHIINVCGIAAKARAEIEADRNNKQAQLNALENEIREAEANKKSDASKINSMRENLVNKKKVLEAELDALIRQKTEYVNERIDKAIAVVANYYKQPIYEKTSVLVGGKDVTEEVLSKVNAEIQQPK